MLKGRWGNWGSWGSIFRVVPKYLQIFYDLQEKILSGRWVTGMMLPSELELCAQYAVSRITIRRSLNELDALGLIVRKQGKGSFVSNANDLKKITHTRKGFTELMSDVGLQVKNRMLDQRVIEADSDVVEYLRLPLNTPHKVWFFRRLRLISDIPVAIMSTYVPYELGQRMAAHDLAKASFYKIYSEVSGKRVIETLGKITAINPEAEDCDLLGVCRGSAHILYESIAYLDGGTPIEVTHSIYNAQVYKFSVNMNSMMPDITFVNDN